jgi:hypothetical protein
LAPVSPLASFFDGVPSTTSFSAEHQPVFLRFGPSEGWQAACKVTLQETHAVNDEHDVNTVAKRNDSESYIPLEAA